MRVSRGVRAATAALAAACVFAGSAQAAGHKVQPLNQYVVTGGDRSQLAHLGFDVSEGRSAKGGGQGIVATPAQADMLRARGFTVQAPYGEVKKAFDAPDPFTDRDLTYGWDVYRPWRLNPAPCPDACSGATDGNGHPVNLKTWYETERAAHPDLVRKVVFGASRYGEPLVAYRVTFGANSSGDASKPVVFYDSTQHAREWLATELERRLFKYVLDHADDQGSGVPAILDSTELWFVPVMNPDGYDYTFESKGTRLWRKTLSDNNGDGQITGADGVDPNRNWPEKWRYDEEGAQDNPQPDDYRGPAPESEPEVKAEGALIGRLKPRYLLDYHTYGPLILYPEGWQVATEGTDAPAMKALAGDQSDPAIPGYFPEVSAALYITNGDITDNAYFKYGTQAYTVEASGGSGPDVGGTRNNDDAFSPGGFVFQDSERDVQTEFNKNRAFALDLAKSAVDPSRPVSHLGNTAPDFVPHTFSQSYGSPQWVEVNARRALGNVRVRWQVNDGPPRQALLQEYEGGTRYGTPGKYYHRLRGLLTGFRAGDTVRVWFTAAGGKTSSAFTFRAVNTTAHDVLVLAAEDYTGNSSVTGAGPGPGPAYLGYYRDALQRLGVSYDVYDVDSQNGVAPDAFGVLSHYKAVIWYTGDDLYVRYPGQPGGTGASKLLNDEILAVRDYINDGGKVLVTGQNALQAAWDQLIYNPLGGPPHSFCKSNTASPTTGADVPPGQSDSCIVTSNDFIQYYLGAWIPIVVAEGDDVATKQFNRAGDVFGTTLFSLNGADSADNQLSTTSFVPTSDILPESDFPQFTSTSSIVAPGKPAYDPFSGTHYAYAASSDESYQRLHRTIDLTGVTSSAHLKFQVSYDTENTYDYVFVEAHTVGADDWTTLPDANGNTTDDVGQSCDIDWNTLHPFLDHYQSNPTPAEDCTNHGTTGAWNGATGNSGGWHAWDIDLSAYKGKQVEVSITYAQDFASAGLGVFLDDVQLVLDGEAGAVESFESGLGDWTAGPPPAGTANQAGWADSTSVGFTDGPGVATQQTELWGFGLEGVRGADTRANLLGDALHYLASTVVPVPPLQPNPQPQPQPSPSPSPGGGGGAVGGAGGPGSHRVAKPRLVRARHYRADRRGRVRVRVRCAGKVACHGRIALVRKHRTVASKGYSLRAGRTATVRLKLSRGAFHHLRRADRVRYTLKLYRGNRKVVKTAHITVREP